MNKSLILLWLLVIYFQPVYAGSISSDVIYDIISKDCANSTISIPERITSDGNPISPIVLPDDSDLLKSFIQEIEGDRPFSIQGGGISILPGLGDGKDLLTCNGKSLTVDGYTFIWGGEVIDPYALYTINQHLQNINAKNFANTVTGDAQAGDNTGLIVFGDISVEKVDISLAISLTVAITFAYYIYRQRKKKSNN